MRLPPPLVDAALRAGHALEVGAGGDLSTALALHKAGARVTVSDVDPRVLLAVRAAGGDATPPEGSVDVAPASLRAILLDVTRPDLSLLGDVGLVYAVRVPEELQIACARLAAALDADLALRALKDEWADLGPRRHVVWPDGWRFIERTAR